jgi:DNA-binding MarR family transcriptional regulator
VLHDLTNYATLLHNCYDYLVTESQNPPKLFGDLLALARRSWVLEMSRRLGELGYPDYRRSDAILLRWLRHGPLPFSELAATLGVSRQAARKFIEGLTMRHFVVVERDQDDARRLNVALTEEGEDYARHVLDVVTALNAQLDEHVDPYDLAVVKSVLRTVSTLYASE